MAEMKALFLTEAQQNKVFPLGAINSVSVQTPR